MHEEWRKIPEYPNYSASNLGRIRNDLSKNQAYTGKIVKGSEKNGYIRYSILDKTGKRCGVFGHRLVAYAFIGPRPKGKIVAHLDGDKKNNKPENLSWVTHKENTSHMKRHGTWQGGENHPLRKLTNENVLRIRSGEFDGMTDAQIGEIFGLSDKTINNVRHFRRWPHITEGQSDGE